MVRLRKTALNSGVTLFFFILTVLVNFIARKIFLVYLGTEYLGLNTTLVSVIDFLFLMELGVTSSVAVALYKPIAEHNRVHINELMWLMRYFYRYVAFAIIVVGLLFSPLIPELTAKSDIASGMSYIAYVAFLLTAAANFFFGYPRVLFRADQKNYILIIANNLIVYVKILLQAISVYYTSNYLYWLFLELSFGIFSHYYVLFQYKSYYKDLEIKSRFTFKKLIQKYNDVFYDAKRIALQSFSGYISRQSSNIIIATVINLSTVTYFGNYMMLFNNVNMMIWTVMQNVWAGVGDLVATSSKEQVYKVYREILSFSFYIQIVIAFGLLVLTQDFITLWLGQEYVLASNVLYLLVASLAFGAFTNANTCFLAAYRFFDDAWMSVLEAFLTAGFGILLTLKFGILGVLGGVLIGILLMFFWKPYYLYKKAFDEYVSSYFVVVSKMFFFSFIIYWIINCVVVKPLKEYLGVNNWGEWLLWAFVCVSIYAIILAIVLAISDKGFSTFVKRFISFRKSKDECR
ncbi:hypothetical protein [Butyricimonas sp.]|uniref:lipopolysaccharide biosynthesis protein n=1 Tax=Butyricimonas sp. TaxID=1969738 RepID=UPI0025BE4678|nr:hypothetical protein [Butyricimonas sp.]